MENVNVEVWDLLQIIAGAVVSLLSFVWMPLRRPDRLGNPAARCALAAFLISAVVIWFFGLSLFWMLAWVGGVAGYLLFRWLRLRRACMAANKVDAKDRDIASLNLLNHMLSRNLFEWEIRKFLLPRLIIFFEIGAMGRLRGALEHLASLGKGYVETSHYVELMGLLLSVSHENHEMLSLLKKRVESTPVSAKDYPFHLNNLYHAAMQAGDSLAIEAVFSKIENYVSGLEDKSAVIVEILIAMMYRYDALGDEAGMARVRGLIAARTPKSFSEYLDLGDIELFYNRRHENHDEIRKYLDEARLTAKRMLKSDESRIRFDLRMVKLYIEFNYGWKEITNELFKNVDFYLNFSDEIALEYIRMLTMAIADIYRLYGLSIEEDKERNLIEHVRAVSLPVVEKYRRSIFNTDDNLLYRKRDAYKFIEEYARVMTLVGAPAEAYVRQLIESENQIIRLCRVNGNLSEEIHLTMSYIDEYLTACDNFRQSPDNAVRPDFAAALNRLRAEEPNIRNLLERIKDELERSDYDRGFAYQILWTANICLYYGDKDSARLLFQKFEGHNIDIRNFTKPVQMMYQRLRWSVGY